jgi:hypothetical protein
MSNLATLIGLQRGFFERPLSAEQQKKKKRTFGGKKIRFNVLARVARWYIFKPKIPIWVNFGGPFIGQY